MVLDLMMPPPDGFEVLYRMRKDPALKEVPVIIVTARELTPADEKILSEAAQRVIRKGADSEQLIEEVLRTLEEQSASRV